MSQAFCGNAVCRTNPGVCKPGCVCCVWSNTNSRCLPPGTCSGTVTSPTPTTTTTAAPIPVGGECASAGQCASGVCCQGGPSAGLCGLADGSDCWSGGNDACCSGACVEGFCVQPGGIGARCDDDGDCLSGLICCDNLATIGNDFTCRDPNTDILNCGGCLNFCTPNELCESGSCNCPSGHELINGGCFEVSVDTSCSGGSCLAASSIAGSGNVLCVTAAGFDCDENDACPEEFVCQTSSGACFGVC